MPRRRDHRHSAGKMRTLVHVQKHDGTMLPRGAPDLADANWENISPTAGAWASIEPMGGMELEKARKLFAETSHLVEMRQTTDYTLTAACRLLVIGSNPARYLYLGRVFSVNERGTKWRALAAEPTPTP